MNSPVDLISALEQEPELALMVSQPPIAFHRSFVDLTGSALAALLLSALVEQHDARAAFDGYLAINAVDIEHRTGLSRREQISARRQLLDLGLIKERRQSFPAQVEVCVCYDAMSRLMVDLAHQRALALKTMAPNAMNNNAPMHHTSMLGPAH